jgi:Secretion system C-terminal sorting domain
LDGADNLWGTTDDGLRLGACSPAVNAGTNTGAPTTDILNGSIFETTKDMGAYERQTEYCPIYTEANSGCDNIAIDNVTGNAWFPFFNQNGIVAAINPNGQNLGTVTMAVEDLSATFIMQNKPFLSRSVNITSSVAPVSNYTLRLFYTNSELAGLNALGGTAYTAANMNIFWLEGGTGCEFANYNGTVNGMIAANNVTTTVYGTNTTATNNGFYAQVVLNHFTIFAASPSTTPLPVKILTFTGTKTQNSHYLTWTTATEQNAATFEIETSTDGSNFKNIGSVAAFGNSTTVKKYDFYTKNYRQGANYYRLKMIDVDGSFEYSNVILLNENDEKNNVVAYPNPNINGIFTLTGEFDNEKTVVINVLGQRIDASISNNILDLSKMPSGIYFLKIESLGGKIIRLVKQAG